MKGYDALTAHGSTEWETPPALYKALDDEFHFTTDPCCTRANMKCPMGYTERGAELPWFGRVFVNPPYGRGVSAWLKRCAKHHDIAVALLPARTDTIWFHDWVLGKAEIRFIKGRVKFVGAQQGATFPSIVAIWWPH